MRWMVLAWIAAFVAPVAAQDGKVAAEKRPVVEKAMQLTEAEAKGFWPVYDAYQKDLARSYERTAKLISDYGEAYAKGPLRDDVAKKLLAEHLAIEQAELALKRSYQDRFAKVLPGNKVLRYFMIESKIRSALQAQLGASIPLPN